MSLDFHLERLRRDYSVTLKAGPFGYSVTLRDELDREQVFISGSCDDPTAALLRAERKALKEFHLRPKPSYLVDGPDPRD